MFVAEAQICKTVQVSTGNGHGILYVGSSPGLVAHTVVVLVGDTLVEEGVEKNLPQWGVCSFISIDFWFYCFEFIGFGWAEEN